MSASGQAGVALHTENVLTSVDVLGGDQVEGKNVMNRWQLLGQMPGIQLAETGQGAESGTSKPASNALLSSATKQGLPKILDGHTVNTMAWVTRERARQPTSANLEESVKPLDGILIPSVELYNFHHRHSITGDREGQIISNNLNLKEII